MKHLADLLRNKANSQQHPSVYEDRRPKSIEDTEKTASGQNGPWDQHGDQGDCSPRPVPTGPAAGLLGESGLMAPSPAKKGLSSTERDLVA